MRFFLGLLLVLGLFGCEQDLQLDFTEESQVVSEQLSSVEEVKALHLDKKYEIPNSVYEEFLKSIVFVDGKFGSAYHAGVEQYFDDKMSNDFWSNFGINIREDVLYSMVAWDNYKKKRPRGCKEKTDHSCSLEIDNSIFSFYVNGHLVSVNEIITRKLDKKFNIPNKIYYEFLGSLIIENNKLRGCMYYDVEQHLTNKNSNNFWNNFGFTIRQDNRSKDYPEPVTVFDAKPKRHGLCRDRRRWICLQNP